MSQTMHEAPALNLNMLLTLTPRDRLFRDVNDRATANIAQGRKETFDDLGAWLNAQGHRALSTGKPFVCGNGARGVAKVVSAAHAYAMKEMGMTEDEAWVIAEAFTNKHGHSAF